jgi:hypothetical protein
MAEWNTGEYNRHLSLQAALAEEPVGELTLGGPNVSWTSAAATARLRRGLRRGARAARCLASIHRKT